MKIKLGKFEKTCLSFSLLFLALDFISTITWCDDSFLREHENNSFYQLGIPLLPSAFLSGLSLVGFGYLIKYVMEDSKYNVFMFFMLVFFPIANISGNYIGLFVVPEIFEGMFGFVYWAAMVLVPSYLGLKIYYRFQSSIVTQQEMTKK